MAQSDHMLSQKLSLTSQFMDMKTRTNSNLFLVLNRFVTNSEQYKYSIQYCIYCNIIKSSCFINLAQPADYTLRAEGVLSSTYVEVRIDSLYICIITIT